MYDIYLKNYVNGSGSVTTTETLIYSVPITESGSYNAFIDPAVKGEMGKTGTFEFTVRQSNPYYKCWQQMKTIARVVYDGTTIFRGRALTIDNSMDGSKKLHFEGDLAFLLDTSQEGSKEAKREEVTILAYLTKLINNHNEQVNEGAVNDRADRRFTLGEVPGQYSSAVTEAMKVKTDATKKFGTDGWVSTMAALEDLQKEYGGYFRTRYVDGTCYLDWLEAWFNPTVNSQQIKLGSNLIDMSNNVEVNNIFTAVIPIGSAKGKEIFIKGYKEDIHGENNRILVPQIVSQFTDDELNSGYHSKSDYQNAVNQYGIIYKIQKFQNATTQEQLWNYCVDWIKNNYVGSITSFDVTALDMRHFGNENIEKIMVGDRVQIFYPDPNPVVGGTVTESTVNKTVTATSVTYYLHNPEKNKYSMGIPNSLISKTYGKANSSGGGGSGTAQTEKDAEREKYDAAIKEFSSNAWNYIIDQKNNNELYQQVVQNYGEGAGETAQKLTWAAWMRGANLLEDPEGKYSEELHNKIPSIITDANSNNLLILGSIRPDLASKYVEENKLLMNTAESMVLDGFVGSLTVKEKLDFGQGPLTDEALAKYVTYYDANPKNAAIVLGNDTDYNQNRSNAAMLKMFKNSPRPLYDPDPDDPLNIMGRTPKLAATVFSGDGSFNGSYTKLGADGTGDVASMIMDGVNSLATFKDPESLLDGVKETIKIDGKDGSTMYKGTDSNDWSITINKPITYENEKGETVTLNNTIKASDFYLNEIGSFKTKFAVIDELIAGKATIGELNAEIANVKELIAQKLTASTLSSAISNLNTVYVNTISGSYATFGTLKVTNFISNKTDSMGNPLNEKLVNGFGTPSYGSDGTVTIPYTTTSGGSGSITFKKAAGGNVTVTPSSNTDGNNSASTLSYGTYYVASSGEGSTPVYFKTPNKARTIQPTRLGFGTSGESIGTLSGVGPGKVVHFKVGDTFYYFLCT